MPEFKKDTPIAKEERKQSTKESERIYRIKAGVPKTK